ncbi:MAG: adenosylcobinamide-GDP ribazoletransferase [Desulfuromonas sp.]|nr:adenosylcobinamide-GDP ribazoletransferase [Desulfuromonas sp.]
MKPFFAALSFLTILRVPHSWCGDERAIARSLNWFPAVGLLIGGVMATLDSLLCRLLPGTLVPSALLVIAMIAISGGLHLDGVADSADAFMSSRGKERMLEVMKDSCVGPMGALTITALLLLKFSALASLPEAWRIPVILLMPLAGRMALVVKTVSLPYARSGGGLATLTHSDSRPWQGMLAFALLALVAMLLLGWSGLWIAVMSLLATALFARYCHGKIGGLTGDTLGAACELVELIPVLTALVCLQQGVLV